MKILEYHRRQQNVERKEEETKLCALNRNWIKLEKTKVHRKVVFKCSILFSLFFSQHSYIVLSIARSVLGNLQ